MGKLFDYRQIIEDKLKDKGADLFKLKGQITLKSGFMVSMINGDTPDDPAKIQALKSAVKEILGVIL